MIYSLIKIKTFFIKVSRICRLDPKDLKILHTSNTTDHLPSVKSVLGKLIKFILIKHL